jgi:catechol 2,3-dioxygenase-like lactoylglutathione lyase family enzyme
MPSSKLPHHASLEHLKKLAKNRLQELRRNDPKAKLTTAQLEVAREYGFPSWRALKAQLDNERGKRVGSPVMRFLPVANLSRSLAFYRNVLGFEIREEEDSVEAVMGPARVRFGKEGYAPTDWSTPKPPGSAILFLESSDVEALHAAVRARGGKPSGIERVNWIKMRVFEIRDPDGNVLWFGQSYHKQQDSPSRRDGQPQGMRKAEPELPCDDVAASVAWYRDVLGFRINYQQHDLGVMDREAITVLLIARTDQHKGIGSCEVFVSDVDALYEELLAKGARILGPPVSHPWGLREFRVIDLEGNRITFGQTFE